MVSLTEREKDIDQLARELRKQYSTNSGVDFRRLAQDHNVGFIETNRLGGGLAYREEGRDYVLGKRDYVCPAAREGTLAHEFGHVLLGHTSPDRPRSYAVMEAETERFAEELTGIGETRGTLLCFADAAFSLLRHPVTTLKYVSGYVFGSHVREAEKIISKIEVEIR